MRRALLLLAVVALVGLTAPSMAPAARTPIDPNVRVSPLGATSTSTIRVRFRAPAAEGERYYVVKMSVRTRQRNCVRSVFRTAAPGHRIRRGERRLVRLRPGKGRRWCRGLWKGSVQRYKAPPSDDYYDDCEADEICRYSATFHAAAAKRKRKPFSPVVGRFRLFIG